MCIKIENNFEEIKLEIISVDWGVNIKGIFIKNIFE